MQANSSASIRIAAPRLGAVPFVPLCGIGELIMKRQERPSHGIASYARTVSVRPNPQEAPGGRRRGGNERRSGSRRGMTVQRGLACHGRSNSNVTGRPLNLAVADPTSPHACANVSARFTYPCDAEPPARGVDVRRLAVRPGPAARTAQPPGRLPLARLRQVADVLPLPS